MNFLNELFNDMAKFGKITSWIILIISIILTFLFFCIGSYLIIKKDTDWENITGTIENVVCETLSIDNGSVQVYDCKLDVKYTLDNNEYYSPLHIISNNNLVKGSTIEFQYNKNNPSLTRQNTSITNKTSGLFLFVIGLFIISFASLNYILAKHSKIYAVGTGTVTLFDIFL
jgi:hypothetical protein